MDIGQWPLIYNKSAFPTVAVLLVSIFNVLMGYRPEIVAAHSPPSLTWVDQGWMRPVADFPSLGSVPQCLTLLSRWQDDHLACKKTNPIIPEGSIRTSTERKSRLTQIWKKVIKTVHLLIIQTVIAMQTIGIKEMHIHQALEYLQVNDMIMMAGSEASLHEKNVNVNSAWILMVWRSILRSGMHWILLDWRRASKQKQILELKMIY